MSSKSSNHIADSLEAAALRLSAESDAWTGQAKLLSVSGPNEDDFEHDIGKIGKLRTFGSGAHNNWWTPQDGEEVSFSNAKILRKGNTITVVTDTNNTFVFEQQTKKVQDADVKTALELLRRFAAKDPKNLVVKRAIRLIEDDSL